MNLRSVLLLWLSTQAPSSLYCRLVNMRNFLTGRKYRVRPAHNNLGDIYRIIECDCLYLYVCRRTRFKLYRWGVKKRLDQLASDYNLTLVGNLRNGLLIDCGANVGELGLWATENGMAYIPFEPEPLEAFCCDLNNRGTRTRRYALWKESAELPFYSKPESADSSMIFMGNVDRTSTVQAVTLDSMLDFAYLAQVPGTIVLKVEAEGAEPEVLEGARDTLAYVDYVSVDCGPERGTEKAHTFEEVANFLIDCGFRPSKLNARRVTVLFRRVIPVKWRQDAIPVS